MTLMLAPSGVAPLTIFKLPVTGNVYTIDSASFVSVTSQSDIAALVAQGFQIAWSGRHNLTAVTDPTVGSDSTVDYQPGSRWLNASLLREWVCLSAAPGAAVWLQSSCGALIGSAGSASFSSLVLSGLLQHSTMTAVTAFSGGGQASATPLTKEINVVTTATATSIPYDSTKFSAVVYGQAIWVINATANPIQHFANGSDTISGFAGNDGVTIQPGDIVLFIGDSSTNWAGKVKQWANDVAYNTNGATGAVTLTGADITGAPDVTLALNGTMSGDENAQLPTVANLFDAIPNAASGQQYRLRIINSSSANHIWTVTTDTGWTLNGTMTIGQNVWRDFYVMLGASTTATLQSLGTGSFS